MRFHPTPLPGVVIVEPEPKTDERGFLARTYCEREFENAGLNIRWTQQNHTLTRQVGSVRGLHLQAPPFPETKLVRCLAGRVFDVAVDLRHDSPTFGQWTAWELSAENRRALYIPGGFAHGFQCLSPDCELLYSMSESYHPDLALGIRCDDSRLAIEWPLPIAQLSERDRTLPDLDSWMASPISREISLTPPE